MADPPFKPPEPDFLGGELQATPRGGPAGDLVRWIYTHNPFYALSAALVFWGLRSSFQTDGQSFQTVALMVGLVSYTLLLALTTYLVIRWGRVWEDGRSQLLLIVVMFLAIGISLMKTGAFDRRR